MTSEVLTATLSTWRPAARGCWRAVPIGAAATAGHPFRLWVWQQLAQVLVCVTQTHLQ